RLNSQIIIGCLESKDFAPDKASISKPSTSIFTNARSGMPAATSSRTTTSTTTELSPNFVAIDPVPLDFPLKDRVAFPGAAPHATVQRRTFLNLLVTNDFSIREERLKLGS